MRIFRGKGLQRNIWDYIKKLLRSMNPVDLLGKIIEISHSNLEITSRTNAILNILAKEMSFDEVVVFTYDEDRRLTCRYMNQKSLLFKILCMYRCHIGEGVIGGIAQKRTPQFFSKKDIPLRFGCLFYPELDGCIEKYKTFSFLPLTDDSYLYGVLVACSSIRESMHDSEKILLSIISREIGGILKANDLFISSKKRISELVTLSELGKLLTSNIEPHTLFKNIGLIVAKALNAAFVTIRMEHAFLKFDLHRITYGEIDPATENYVNGLEKEAVQKKSAVTLKNNILDQDDMSPADLSMYSTPIISKNRVIGVITIGGTKSQQNFTLEQSGQYLVNTIVNYITNGFENTLLNSKLRDVIEELNNAQKRLIEQEKFRSLGEMTANIAHEIKNPLVIIGGFAKRLAKKVYLDRTENRYVDIIIKEVSRLEAVLNEILDYVKETHAPRETCNMNDCIDEILYLFSSVPTWEKIEIEKETDSNLPVIMCDVQQIKQVFINILVNAFEAMHGVGKITIRTEQTVLDNNPCLVVSIADTGGGINPAAIDNIFNPFFTTKEKGTGLGLAISNRIIMNHFGRIEVKNMAGKGVTFFVYLPLKENIIKEELL
ncbi:MAG: ATP-binding protein [Proteobacteria bacterium]|nr:ATP-binding protein [Pseudomonadota bacterium]